MSNRMYVVRYTIYGRQRQTEAWAYTAREAERAVREAYPLAENVRATPRRAV